MYDLEKKNNKKTFLHTPKKKRSYFLNVAFAPHLVSKKYFYKQDDIAALRDINMICSLICKAPGYLARRR